VHTLQDKLGRTAEQTDRQVKELPTHFPEARVEVGYRNLIPAMTNSEKHRHVLAAAVITPCEVIVTYNLKDFPEEALRPFGIEAKHPDEFLIDLYYIDGEIVVHLLHEPGSALRKPRPINEVLTSLETCRCTQFAQLIRQRPAL
jgi:hypothetical protein